ncbi:MAG: MBL fold metallo-hydrolase [Rudaea sp.]
MTNSKWLFGIASALVAVNAIAQYDDPATVTLKTTHVAGPVSQIEGIGGFGGGNVAVSAGADGVLIVDPMTAPMGTKLQAELAKISPAPVRMVVNTHFHDDHTGGDAAFASTAVIVAHENTRTHLRARHAERIWPHVTFTDQMTLHFNGEDIRLWHCPNAHTDGDTIVIFTGSKVAHFGDLFFNGMFPAVYREGGGDWNGFIACLDHAMAEIPEGSKIIAGHGPLGDIESLKAYVAMLKDSTAIVREHRSRGETAQQMIAAHVLARYDALGSGGAQTTEQYITMVDKLLSSEVKR